MDCLIQVKVICSSISLFTSTVVACCCIIFIKPTTLTLDFADALFTIVSITINLQQYYWTMAFLVNYSRQSSIIYWMGIFAYNMSATIVDNQELPGILKFYVIAISIPFILSAYPFALDAYGLHYSMCWLLPESIALIVVDYLKIYNFLFKITEMKSQTIPLSYFCSPYLNLDHD